MSGVVERNKRGILDRLYGSYCSNSGAYCGTCAIGSNCLGLCGPGCTCWLYVCGDCCYNSGCYIHDVYSCSGGTDTVLCWVTAPIGLVCTIYQASNSVFLVIYKCMHIHYNVTKFADSQFELLFFFYVFLYAAFFLIFHQF